MKSHLSLGGADHFNAQQLLSSEFWGNEYPDWFHVVKFGLEYALICLVKRRIRVRW